MKTEFKKLAASAVLGLSVIISSGGLSVMNPLTVQAAVSKPKINLTKKRTITVGRGSQLELYKNVIKSVKRGSYSVKSVTVKAVKAKNGKRISIKNSSALAAGKIPAKTLKFPTTAGTYKLKVTAKDTKGNASNSTVSFKVRTKKLSGYVTGLKNYKVKKGSSVNFMKGVKYDKTCVKSVKANSAAVDLDEVGNYKVVYTITGVAGDKIKVSKKVEVYVDSSVKFPTPDADNPTPTTPADTGTPASHVKGITDRVVLRASKNFNLMDGVSWDSTIKSVQCLYNSEGVDPYHYNLPAFGEKDSAPIMYAHETIDYLITTKSDKKQRVECNLYVVDLPTAKDLANNNVTVYSSNNVHVQPDPNVRRTCTLKVTATKITVPRHPLYVCYNCCEEIAKLDYDWIDEHNNDSYFGKEGSIPGCGSGWLTAVEAFTINR